jgi:F-type H+-transporting ATPase subunit delta
MTVSALPKRYARALLAAVGDRQLDPDKVAAELSALAAHFRHGSEMQSYFANPFISLANKRRSLEAVIAKAGLSPVLASFLRLLLAKGRLFFLPEVATHFQALADSLAGVMRGEVLVAAELPKETLEALRHRLTEHLGKKVLLTVKQQPELIGGLTVRIGSLSFDGSIRAQLDRLKATLLERVNR